MYCKVYFNEKPLFLCDSIDPSIAPYLHHDDAVYIDEFSPHAIKSMIHEMETPRIHAGIFLHTNLPELKKAFWKKFTLQIAGGGLVFNANKEMLFIFRRNKWDLPKGKLEAGETVEACAVREVEEETGLKKVVPKRFLVNTYHTYHESGKHVMKESFWYLMEVPGNPELIPQVEEDITQATWIKPEALTKILSNTYPSIKEVIALVNS